MNNNIVRLTYLYDAYSNGYCTEEERKEFLALAAQDDLSETLKQLIEKDIETAPVDQVIAAPRADELYHVILAKGKKQYDNTARKGRMVFFRKLAVAASIIFVLGAGSYFMFLKNSGNKLVRNNDTRPTIFNNDVAPGGNKAILKLADGSEILLDSASNGTLAMQGGTQVVKLDNGAIAYNGTNGDGSELLYNTITTPFGGQYHLILADGSKVWMNAGSSLRYPSVFRGAERKVALTGEAYFEIAKNAGMPFRVVVGGMEVEVLGTHFNINSYHDEPLIKTTLLEGAVKITQGDNRQLLEPGQQAQLSKKGVLKLLREVDTEEAMAWKNGQFIFSGNDLPSVMRQLEKWYDIDVEYRSNITKEEFVGVISRNVNISQILNMLEKTRTVNFEIEGKKVIVK